MQTNISWTAVTNLTSFGALTNNETRAVVLQNSLTISNNGNAGAIRMFDAVGSSVSFSNTGDAISFSGGVIAESFVGDGGSLTDLDGASITSGTISSNKMDATAYVAFMTGGNSVAAGTNVVTVTNGSLVTVSGTANVTQAGLADASYDINPQALTGFLTWSSTNTVNAGSSNAITVVSNVTHYASFILTNAVGAGIAGTYYYHSPGVLTNNAGDGAVFWTGSEPDPLYQSAVQITNAAHPTIDSDIAGYIAVNGQENFPSITYSNGVDEILQGDASSPFSPQVFITGVTLGLSPAYARFHGDIPLPAGGLTNNWKASNPVIYITNTVYVQKLYGFSPGFELNVDFAAPYTQPFMYLTNNLFKFSGGASSAFQFVWGPTANSYIDFNNGTSAYGFLMRSKIGVGIECPSDQGVIRLTDDHRTDGHVKLAGQLVGADTGRYVTNNFSGMLGFQSFGGTDGAPFTGLAGIRAKNAAGATVYNQGGVDLQHSELWLYTLIPPQLSNSLGGFRIVGDTNWFAIGVTNSTIVKGLTIVSNPVSIWPTAPRTPGDTYFGNSNGIIYALYSGVAATWVKTNLISGP